MGSAGDEHAVAAREALRPVLDDGRPDVRYAAALSLGELRDPSAVDRLILMLEDQAIMPRQAAAIALGKIGDGRATDALIRALDDGPPDVRFQATASLVELDGVRAVGPLIRALEDRDAEVRTSAAAGLGDLRAHAAADGLALLLKDGVETVRFEAAYALCRLGDLRGREPLCRLTTDREFGYIACEELGRLGHAEAVPALERAWKRVFVHPSTRVRAAASLIQLGQEAPKAFLLRKSRSLRRDVRGFALEMLGEVGGEWALKPLLEALGGRSADAACRALGRLGNPRAVLPLKEALAKERRSRPPDEELCADIEQALGRLEAVG